MNNRQQDDQRSGLFSRAWVRGVGCSLIAGVLLFVATESGLLDKSALAKWTFVIIALFLIVYSILPWALLTIIYLTLNKMGSVEDHLKRHLLRRSPGSHYLRTMFDPSYHSETLFAVTALVWSKHHLDQLLWVMHRTHKRWLPPGGRLLANELPHEAIMTKVCSETGIPLDKLSFCRIFHTVDDDYVAAGENIEGAPIPLRIQKEVMEQRGGIPYHYDFFYVLETNYDGILRGDQNPQWLTIEAVEKSQENERPFPNVCLLARHVLCTVSKRMDRKETDTE